MKENKKAKQIESVSEEMVIAMFENLIFTSS